LFVLFFWCWEIENNGILPGESIGKNVCSCIRERSRDGQNSGVSKINHQQFGY
jgi:hypothetical protein